MTRRFSIPGFFNSLLGPLTRRNSAAVKEANCTKVVHRSVSSLTRVSVRSPRARAFRRPEALARFLRLFKGMRMLMYIFGTLIVTGALAYAAIVLLGLPTLWVGIACLVVLGLGIMGAASTGPTRLVRRTTRTSNVITPVAPADSVTVTDERL